LLRGQEEGYSEAEELYLTSLRVREENRKKEFQNWRERIRKEGRRAPLGKECKILLKVDSPP